jgi:hypothetical protein
VNVNLSGLRPVYEHDGPFATVYLEGRAPGADADEQLRLRWRALRERLESEGAAAGALDAIEVELGRHAAGEEHANGRVLVANDSGVRLDEPWDAALGSGDDAHWAVLPELGAYAREAARSVRQLVVICDAQGAQVRQEVVAEQHEPREVASAEVSGSGTEGVHKPRGGALSHNQIQRRADETVQRNAKDVVEHVRKTAAGFRPRVIVLAGEVQARTAVRQQLTDDNAELVTETDRGGRDEHASGEALNDELLQIASEQSTLSAQRYAEQLKAGLAHDLAVQGSEHVAQAAETGAVETLLFEHGEPAYREAFLLQVCTGTSSRLGLVAGGTALLDGVAAILRFPLPQ